MSKILLSKNTTQLRRLKLEIYEFSASILYTLKVKEDFDIEVSQDIQFEMVLNSPKQKSRKISGWFHTDVKL